MNLKISYELGTLKCEFKLIKIWFCDNQSNECFESFEKRMQSFYGGGFKINYLIFDTDSCDIKVYKVLQDTVLPWVGVSYHTFFKYAAGCDLMEFVNMFSRMKLEYVDGNPKMSRNRFYIRS